MRKGIKHIKQTKKRKEKKKEKNEEKKKALFGSQWREIKKLKINIP